MKILHINTEPTWRGGEQQVLYLMLGLRKAGIPQVIVCQPDGEMAKRARERDLPVIELRMHGEVDLPAAWRLAGIMAEEKADLVHMHTSHGHTLGVVGAWLHGQPRPKTLVARRVDFSIFRHSFLGLNRIKYTWGVDRIVCVSDAIRQVLLKDGLPPELLGVVHSGIDLSRFENVPDQSAEYAEEFGIPPDATVLGNVAHCADHKGQRYLVSAVPHLLDAHPDLRVLIVGDGELRPALMEQARDLGVDHAITFPGFRTDVPALLRYFDIFCFPSHKEGLGTSVLDALAMEKPVVATTAGGIPEMIVDGVHGLLVPAREPERLARAIDYTLNNPERAARMGRAGREKVERGFTTEAMVRKTIAEYERLLNEG